MINSLLSFRPQGEILVVRPKAVILGRSLGMVMGFLAEFILNIVKGSK
jgi:hypothetical protein